MGGTSLGAIIGGLRQGTGKSQEALAEELGVSRSKVKHWEAGTREIKAEDIILIAEYFGVSAGYILGLEKEPTNNPEIRTICDYTGLSVKAVEALHNGLSFPTANLKQAGFLLLNQIIESSDGAPRILLALMEAKSRYLRLTKQLEELSTHDLGMCDKFDVMNRIRKEIIVEKVDAQEIFETWFDVITNYRKVRTTLDELLSDELEK